MRTSRNIQLKCSGKNLVLKHQLLVSKELHPEDIASHVTAPLVMISNIFVNK